jgi:hypothetical protein
LTDREYIVGELLEARIVGFRFRTDEKVQPLQVRQKPSSHQFAQSPFDAVSFDDIAPVFRDDDSDSWI